ncbi:MAG: non-canonical purine NTP diphosphatase [Bacteroidales bacterium]|nr:non-canonical purine NTP diphosphatase [Bacteroidales bacterium]
MDKLVFATNNKHKITEVAPLLPSHLKLLSLADIQCFEEIEEPHNTLIDNAFEKARFVYNRYKYNCFADDTGLEIDALDGRPGVFSARYAGENCSFEDNVKKVLQEMQGKSLRSARFKTVIALIIDGKEYSFEGAVEGEIIDHKSGKEGFGYDPIFKPIAYTETFAEISLEEKNKISHRGLATKKLIAFLNTLV